MDAHDEEDIQHFLAFHAATAAVLMVAEAYQEEVEGHSHAAVADVDIAATDTVATAIAEAVD